MIKVLTVVGTRPEIIKMSSIIRELEETTKHVLVHTGQNYSFELNDIFFNQLGLRKPDYNLNAAGKTPSETIANVIARTDEVLAVEKPDAFVIYGDTNSCIAVIAAKKRKIPVFHIEAGNRCFDQRVPEENNRKIVDHLSDINITLSEHARRYLIAEGIPQERIFKTGSPMKEVIKKHWDGIINSNVLEQLGLQKRKFFIVSAHREENVDDKRRLKKLIKTIEDLHSEYGHKVLISTHPRTRQRLDELNLENTNPEIVYLPPFGFFEYANLMMNALCVVSDSGTITEEAAILGFNAVMIREANERPEGIDAGVLIMAGLETQSVLNAIRITIRQGGATENLMKVPDYETETVSIKVVRIIHSYYSYVNEKIWHK